MDLGGYRTVGDPDDDRPVTKEDEKRQAEWERTHEWAMEVVAAAPPLDAETAEKIGRLLSGKTPAHQLMRWRLRLFCGHVIERTQHTDHPTYLSWHGPCPECGRDPVALIASRPLGLAADVPTPPPTPHMSPTTLERQLAKAKAEVERLERELRNSVDAAGARAVTAEGARPGGM